MQNLSKERAGVHMVGMAAAELGIIFRELPTSDQGVDGQFELTSLDGRANGRLIAAQIKAGSSWFKEETELAFVFRPSERHRTYWINHSLPVIVILCDLDAKECYWELVTEDTCLSTGIGWRIDVPKSKTLRSLDDLSDIATPVAAASDFTIVGTHDVSTGIARRISLDVVVHPSQKAASKSNIAAVVRAAVSLGRHTDYARDKISAAIHDGKSAEMVSGFVYLREVDRAAAQWVCQFQWTSEAIAEEARYQGVSGEIDSDGLVIGWQLDRSIAKFLDERRRGKGEYLALVDELLERLPEVMNELEAFHSAGCPEEASQKVAATSKHFEQSWDDGKAAPAECQRLDQAIGELVAHVGNLRFIWGEGSRYSHQNAKRLFDSILNDLERVIADIKFLRRDAR